MRSIIKILLGMVVVAAIATPAGAGPGEDAEWPSCLDFLEGSSAGYNWKEVDPKGDDLPDSVDPLKQNKSDNYWEGTLTVLMNRGNSPDPICGKAVYRLYVAGTTAADPASPYFGTVPQDNPGTVTFDPVVSTNDYEQTSLGSQDQDRTVCIRVTSSVGNSTFDRAPDTGCLTVKEGDTGASGFH